MAITQSSIQEVERARMGYNPSAGRYKLANANVGERVDPNRLLSYRPIKRFAGSYKLGGQLDTKHFNDPTANGQVSRFSTIKYKNGTNEIDWSGGNPLDNGATTVANNGITQEVDTPGPSVNRTMGGDNASIIPYLSNIINAGRRLPAPIAPPTETPINPALVNYDAERNAIDQSYRELGKETDLKVPNTGVAQAIKATGMGKKIMGRNQLAQQEGNTNAFIKNQTNQANQAILGRNIERTREFNDQTISRDINQQNLQTSNLANASDKYQMQTRDKALMDLEGRKLDILPTLYKDTIGPNGKTLFDRNGYSGMTEEEQRRLGYIKKFGGPIQRYKSGGSIHINPANKGKFNVLKARTGKSTEELTHSKNPLTRKRAIFAQNASKWHH